MPPPIGRFTCVVDDHPRFHLDALRWFASLTEVAGVEPSDLVVHVVGPRSSEPLEYLVARGVTVRPVDRFDRRSPHCNKIAGALELAEKGVEGSAVLCDTDVVVLEDPRGIDLPVDSVAGKPVDASVPPLTVLVGIFEAAGLPVPPTTSLPWGTDEATVAGNSNGGLYVIPGTLLGRVSSAWAEWARWLLDRLELLEEWPIYADQVAMALGLAAEQVGSLPLGVRWNTPTHDPSRIPADAPVPAVIHYHQEVDDAGLLRTTGVAAIDERIGTANAAIAAVWAAAPPGETHRRWLELRHPSPDGPTPGSPTSTLSDPARPLLERIVAILRPDSIYEVGAPGETPHPADLVVSIDRPGRPADAGDAADSADRVARLWSASGQALLVSGPAGSDDLGSGTSGALAAVIERTAPDAEVYPVTRDGDRVTLVVLRPPTGQHPRDFTAGTLRPLAARLPDPLALMELRLASRASTGFYPDHAPRLWEYPVAARLLMEDLPPGSRLVDVGAGVTPLAPFLTTRGYVVDTVDPSPTVREWPPRPEWNEWDYLDYGSAGLAHRSWNTTLDRLPLRPRFDGAYSISVIEHVPGGARRSLLADMAARVRPGGLVVVTIDLVRGGDILWNRSRGEEVEGVDIHGTFDDVVDEAAAVGLRLLHRESVREWGDVEVDIGLATFRREVEDPAPPATGLIRSVARRLRR